MIVYYFHCPHPKAHFGYGHTDSCYHMIKGQEVAERAFERYTDEEACMGVHEAVISALESFQPEPHPDANYSEPIRD